MFMRSGLAAAIVLATFSIGHAQDVFTGTVTKENFDPDGLTNPDSSLVQEWVVVNDPELPVRIDASKFFGITLHRTQDRGLAADVVIPLESSRSITAISVHLVFLDLWNEVGRTFDLTEAFDVAPGAEMLTGRWNINSQADAEAMRQLVVYVKQVRTEDGTIMSADMAPVLREIRKIAPNAVEADIRPIQKDQ